MSSKKIFTLGVISLISSVIVSCSFESPSSTSNTKKQSSFFDLPNLFSNSQNTNGSNNGSVSSDGSSKDGLLGDKASNANPGGISPSSISQPNAISSPILTNSPLPSSSSSAAPNSSSGTTGQVNIIVNPNPPTPRTAF